MVYQTDLMEEERQLPTAGTRSKFPAFHSRVCCLPAASALRSAGLFANSANREAASSYPSHCRDCRTLCQLLPCRASLPDPGLPDISCQPTSLHAGMHHSLSCLARNQLNFLSQTHGQLWIMSVPRDQGKVKLEQSADASVLASSD